MLPQRVTTWRGERNASVSPAESVEQPTINGLGYDLLVEVGNEEVAIAHSAQHFQLLVADLKNDKSGHAAHSGRSS